MFSTTSHVVSAIDAVSNCTVFHLTSHGLFVRFFNNLHWIVCLDVTHMCIVSQFLNVTLKLKKAFRINILSFEEEKANAKSDNFAFSFFIPLKENSSESKIS